MPGEPSSGRRITATSLPTGGRTSVVRAGALAPLVLALLLATCESAFVAAADRIAAATLRQAQAIAAMIAQGEDEAQPFPPDDRVADLGAVF